MKFLVNLINRDLIIKSQSLSLKLPDKDNHYLLTILFATVFLSINLKIQIPAV